MHQPLIDKSDLMIYGIESDEYLDISSIEPSILTISQPENDLFLNNKDSTSRIHIKSKQREKHQKRRQIKKSTWPKKY